MKRIRIGLIGCSSIAYRSLLPAIAANSRFEVAAIGSRSVEKAQRFAKEFGGRACTYEDIIDDNSISAVYLSLPVGLHFEWAFRALESHKHILVEKTFTHSEATAAALIEEGMRRQLVVMEALTYVYHPLFGQVQSAVESGSLGELRHVAAHFGFPYLPETDIRNQAQLGGGAILDTLIYPLSLCLHILGYQYNNCHYNIVFDEHRRIDTRGFLQLDWGDKSAQIAYGFGFTYRNNYTIWGEHACLIAERAFSRPKDLVNDIRIVRQGTIETITVPAADQFEIMLSVFADHIQGNSKSTLNVGQDILNRMQIISRLYEQFGGPSRAK